MTIQLLQNMPWSLRKGMSKGLKFNSAGQDTASAVGNSYVSKQPFARWTFEVAMDHVQGQENLSNAYTSIMMGTYMACCGRTFPFLFVDPQDNQVLNMQFGVGDGSTKNFQLSRGVGGATDIVQFPQGSITVFVNGTLTTTYSLSSTGVVQFTSAPAIAAVLTWTGNFAFYCRFDSDQQEMVRDFTTNNGVDQWSIDSIKFTSEFAPASLSGVVLAGGGSGGTFIPPSSGIPISQTPQLGDILRYNVNGDNAYDAVNYAQQFSSISPVWGGNPIAVGPMTTGLGSAGSRNSVNPTATVGTGDKYSAAATASTSTVIGVTTGQNGSNSVTGMLAFYRWTLKWAAGNTTSVRYWMGLGCFNSSGTGSNTAGILSSTAYANDTPNKTTLGFRFSAGTDTHWQAVSINAGGSQTTVDTGITPDTNVHLFEMTTNATGTSVFFLIDALLVATITTNLPIVANTSNSWGNMFWSGDNKNTNTAISGTQYGWNIALK